MPDETPLPMPQQGGSYERQKDGSLKLIEQTVPLAPFADAAPAEPAKPAEVPFPPVKKDK